MTDAYEIGIQLLLQDDVSAGLAVINQGLAEVDRAIAATSANLAGLVQEANTATKAAAAAAGPSAKPTGQVTSAVASAAEPAVAPGSERAPDREPAAEMPVRQWVAEPRQGEAAAVTASAPPVAPAIVAEPKAVDRVLETPAAVAPVSPVAEGMSGADRAAPAVEAVPAMPSVSPAPVEPPPSAPMQVSVAVAANAAAPVREHITREPTPGVPRPSAPAAAAAPAAAPATVTASIDRSGMPEGAGGQTAMRPTAPRHEPRRRERAVAPQVGAEPKGAGEAKSARDPAAPTLSTREANESSGGNVMLDGRLVGQWMADHMAREASRPPSGTSFFDPRQTPAWNISGAL